MIERMGLADWVVKTGVGLVILALFFWIYGHQHHFPYWYHWDEEGKAEQVLAGTRNLHHPLLLVNLAEAAFRVLGNWGGYQRATEIGRLVSAGCMALAVLGWIGLAGRLRGWVAAGAVALLVGLQGEVIELAHFFKEDPALVMGWTAALCALQGYGARPNKWTAAAVGLGLGLSASAKHVGWLIVPVLVVAMATASGLERRRRWRDIGIAIAVGLALWAAINHAFFLPGHGLVLKAQLEREIRFLYDNNQALVSRFDFLRRMGWPLGLGLIVYGVGVWRRRGVSRMEAAVIGLAGLYALGLMVITRVVPRYYLPLWAMMGCLAGVGCADAWAALRAGRWRWVAVGGLTVLLGGQVFSGWSAWRGWAGPDHRLELARFIDRHLPEARVAYGLSVGLPDLAKGPRRWEGWAPRNDLEALSTWSHLPPDFDPLADLRARGITHVAVNRAVIGLYENAARQYPHKTWGQFSDAPRRSRFYAALKRGGGPVWESPPGPRHFLQPSLALYRLPEEGP